MSNAGRFLAAPLAVAFALASTAGNAHAQGDAGEQTYLVVKLENVQVVNYSQGVLEKQIGSALGGAGVKYTPAQLSAASRDAIAGLKARLAGRTGTAELVICVPPGSQNCIEIVCKLCSAE